MSATLYYAPLAAGKTRWAVERVRKLSRERGAKPYVVVASTLQLDAFQRRLARAGGALGVHVVTLPGFCRQCLTAAGEPPVVPRREMLDRLIEAAAGQEGLYRLAPLADKPGFWDAMRRLMAEAKAAAIGPEYLARHVDAVPSPSRLRDLVTVYAAYQKLLQGLHWVDNEDALVLTRDALERGSLGADGRLPETLIFDGFDDLTPVQVEILRALAVRTDLTVLLTAHPQASAERYRRYQRTRAEVEQALGVEARPLPRIASGERDNDAGPRQEGPRQLVEALSLPRRGANGPAPSVTDGVELMACSDRLSEVRAALRWLKARIVNDDEVSVDRAALIMRSLDGYRASVRAVAREYGLPIRLVGGLPLGQSPVIRAVLDLLATQRPLEDDPSQPSLKRRQVLDAWRSPYLEWAAKEAAGATAIGESDVAYLQQLAQRYRVIEGLEQWADAFRREERRLEQERADDAALDRLDHLRRCWDLFLARMGPPSGRQSYRVWVGWLEDRIGADPEERARRRREREDSADSLGIVRRVRETPDGGQEDIAALQALKDVLRAMVQVEEALRLPPADYATFVARLEKAVLAARYRLPLSPGKAHLLVLDVAQARGLSFEAAAVIGLAEGEFPVVIREDVFLSDADREALRDRGLRFQPSTESYEAELFLVALSRAASKLLLTRPRLADNGTPWQPSPYWEEIRQHVVAEPARIGGDRLPSPSEAASLSEALAWLRAEAGDEVSAWLMQDHAKDVSLVRDAIARLHAQRHRWTSQDGDLAPVATIVAHQFGARKRISATRLETYASCPYRFFAQHVLHLEAIEPVREGLDAAQLGNIYHRILAEAYAHPDVADPADAEQVLAVLPEVLASVLDEAPDAEGFRPTAWWRYTREEIAQHVEESIRALAEMGPYQPRWFEQRLGRDEFPPLVLYRGEDQLAITGIVDRIDVGPDGGVRVIDYKTAGKGDYGKRALEQGEKLQVALYALAVRDAMGLGEPVDGFYWHVRQAEPSGLQLAKYGSGPQDALDVATEHAWRIVDGIRAGAFAPRPPRGGCPSYCPAASYCWWYRKGWRG
ncbi:MAG: PD-(D/E)XK nuclease family protein [Anaerolineae bacterium]